MLGTDPLTTLYLALEDTPGDDLALMALADCYLDAGNPDAAACLRWALGRGRRPFRYTAGSLLVQSAQMVPGHWWWVSDARADSSPWGYPRSCRLPPVMWRHLPHSFDYRPLVFKPYATLREAFEALFHAWPLRPAQDRAIARREVRR